MDPLPALYGISARMESVKAACDRAPAGPKKDTALWHYTAARTALAANHEGECDRKLDATLHALS